MHVPAQDSPRTPLQDIALAVLSCIIVNALIFGLHWDGPSSNARGASLAPPDWFVGLVWVGLFVCMGIVRFRLRRHPDKGAQRRLIVLAVSDLAYPFYTLAFHSAYAGFLGNLMTILFAMSFLVQAWRTDKVSAILIFLQVLWALFASLITLQELGALH